MSRPLRAVIDHQALINNLHRVQAVASGSVVMAVVKANGYGHGAVEVARTLLAAGAGSLAVIGLDEALHLREGGIQAPITLLQGFYHHAELPEISAQRLAVVLHSTAQLDDLLQYGGSLPNALRAWIKVDTGMHRLGFQASALASVLERLARSPAIAPLPGLFSHLATADLTDDADASAQIARFQALARRYPQMDTSLANSAAVLGWPGSHAAQRSANRRNYVRPGIMLYGSSPFTGGASADELGLQPVMRLQSELIAVQALRSGDRVGYGGRWQCPEDMPVGLVACGYGDGYPRHAPDGTPVQVGGARVPLIGRVSMDTLCVDLRGCANPQPGDPVVLWGEDPGIDELASVAGTIAYEPLSQITVRVPRRHIHLQEQLQ